jgi:HAD superfamily hydrolase (TIGR01509 family)
MSDHTVDANGMDIGSTPPAAGTAGEEPAGDEAGTTGRASQIERLAGRSWMAFEAGEAALRAASHYLDPADVRERARRLAVERAETDAQLHRLAHDLHTDSPLLHWLDEPTATRKLLGLPIGVSACLFDLDSVLTTSTSIHVAAWADTFDSFLLARAARHPEPFIPFDRAAEYHAYLAERPRLDGVRTFLASRGIRLPEGEPGDPPDVESVHGLANRKSKAVQQHLGREGVAAYIGSRCYLEAAHLVGLGRAVVSESANTTEILERAGLTHLIDQRIDAHTIESERLAPKPEPDTLIAACRLLGVDPAEAADFETTPAGIQAARSAGIGVIIAVEREGTLDTLHAAGPDVIVSDLAQLLERRGSA